MRDAVWAAFPQMEAIEDPPTKRFRIPSGLDSLFQTPTAEELAALRTAADSYAAGGAEGRAAALYALERKLLSALRGAARRKVAPDVEALVQAETIAVHPGPRPFESEEVLTAIRTAVKGLQALSFRYEGGSAPGRTRKVTPLGILFGHSNYLVATEGEGPSSAHLPAGSHAGRHGAGRAGPAAGGLLAAGLRRRELRHLSRPIEDVVLRIARRPRRRRPALALPSQPDRDPGAGRLGHRDVPGQRHAGAVLAPVHLGRRGGDRLAAGLREMMVEELKTALEGARGRPDLTSEARFG
jgi:hypothetical protein